MKTLIKDYLDWILGIGALALIGAVISFYIWGVNALVADFDRALSAESVSQSSVRFNIGEIRLILQTKGLSE